MDTPTRLVKRLPLTELWTDSAPLEAVQCGPLGKDEIVQLLREGRVRFVVADVGKKLRWIPQDECFKFWTKEVLPHLAEPEAKVNLEQFPGNYCFWASKWQAEGTQTIVVLERAH